MHIGRFIANATIAFGIATLPLLACGGSPAGAGFNSSTKDNVSESHATTSAISSDTSVSPFTCTGQSVVNHYTYHFDYDGSGHGSFYETNGQATTVIASNLPCQMSRPTPPPGNRDRELPIDGIGRQTWGFGAAPGPGSGYQVGISFDAPGSGTGTGLARVCIDDNCPIVSGLEDTFGYFTHLSCTGIVST